MKKRFNAIQVFLATAISFFILVFPTYRRIHKLSHIKFVRTVLSFVLPDQKQEPFKEKKELKRFGRTAFLIVFLTGIKLLDRFAGCFAYPFRFMRNPSSSAVEKSLLFRFLFLFISAPALYRIFGFGTVLELILTEEAIRDN